MTIEETMRIALEAHDGQKDLEGNPAILHVLAVALMGETELEQKVGLLHDVVEDSDITIENLRERGVEEDVLVAVDLLTHRDDISYEEYVKNIFFSGNETAIRVKVNDLHQNEQRMEKTLWRIVHADKLDAKKLDMYAEIDRKHTWALGFFDSNPGPFPAVN